MKGCCCCFDLRTGGLILGYLTTIGGCLSILTAISNPASGVVSGLISAAFGALCLYGIYKEKSAYMLPYIVLSWAGIVFAYIMVIYLPIDWYGDGKFKNSIINAIDFNNEEQQKEFIHSLGVTYAVIWTIFAIVATLGIYFVLVMQALYRSIKEGARGLPTTQQGYIQ